MTKVNDIARVETNFVSNLGNGVKAAEYLSQLVAAVVSSRDTTIITRIMGKMDAKSDAQAVSSVRITLGQVFPGAKLSKDKEGKYSFKIKGVEADDKALARLKEAADKGLSIRHHAFRKTIKPDTEVKEFDPKAWVERQAKAHPDDLEAMIAALQAQRG